MADKYLSSSFFTLGARMTIPIMLGTIIAKIMASEKSMTDPRLAAEPMITKKQNMSLYVYSIFLERPNK
jgi:hypothetical protein